MYYSQTRPASPPLITFAQMQSQLRITTDDEAQYIADLIDAATEYAEQALDSSLLTRVISVVYTTPQVFDLTGTSGMAVDFPSSWAQGQRFYLPRGPVSIGSVISAIDTNAKSLTFTQDRRGLADYCVLTPGQAFVAPLTITYTAGYGAAAAAVPADLRMAIRTHTATLFENRESVSEGKTLAAVPHSLEAFYRLRRRACPVA